MTEEDLLEELKRAIIKGDSQKTILLVNESSNMGIQVKEILNRAILKGAEEAGGESCNGTCH